MIAALAASLVLAAGDAPAAEVDEIRACVADSATPMDCVGLTVKACTARPGGDTTVGMVACIEAEHGAWDTILNEEYRETMSRLRAMDETGDVAAADMTRVETLREAQRAWIVFRDAECRAQYALFGGGTLRQVVGWNCVMDETAERAIEIREMRQE